jgi:hypothetical protein
MIFISSLKSIIWPYIVKIKYEELKVISRNRKSYSWAIIRCLQIY